MSRNVLQTLFIMYDQLYKGPSGPRLAASSGCFVFYKAREGADGRTDIWMDGQLKRQTCRDLMQQKGTWSNYWAKSAVAWEAHAERGHDTASWSKPIYFHRFVRFPAGSI